MTCLRRMWLEPLEPVAIYSVGPLDLLDTRPARASRKRIARMLLNEVQPGDHYTSEQPLSKRQRRRLRGKTKGQP